MKIGNMNFFNFANITAQRNKAVVDTLLSNANKTKQPASDLMDVFSKSSHADLNFGYADLAKNTNANRLSISDSLRIDPSQPLQTPERSYVEMEHVTKEQIDFKMHFNNKVNYSEMFLGGLGDQAFNKFLADKGIALPEDAKFDISVDGYGKVTVSGLEDKGLTNRLQDAMSYDFPFIRSVLTMFEQSKRTIENGAVDGGMGMSNDQHWKMQISSSLLTDYDESVSLADLSHDENGKIQGLPKNLYNKIYGDRSGMSRMESDNLDFLRDKISFFINKGPENVPAYKTSLTYSDGKVRVN